MFALENAQTRQSLRNVFDNIFVKYGRDFNEDDEIDLVNLKVTKRGGHLARLRTLSFGTVFRHKKGVHGRGHEGDSQDSQSQSQSQTQSQLPDPDPAVEDVFEAERRRLEPAVSDQMVAQIRSSFNRAVASTKTKPGSSFDVVLFGMIREQEEGRRNTSRRQRLLAHSHASSEHQDCFDCTLLALL